MVMSDNPSSEVQLNSELDSQFGICAANAEFMPEPIVHPVAKFLLALKEINIYIAIQSVLDAVDLWLGALKYYYDILNPIGNKASSAMMYAELRTPVGLLVFLLGGVFFATFAFLGNYYDPKRKDSKLPEFSKYADASWPFVRDCLKGLKWTFKGTKSVLIVMNLLLQLNFTSMIAPLGIIFGILAASNRFWNRGMVEKRKELQAINNAFRENIKYINTCFMEITDSNWLANFDNLSEENKSCYRGCVIKISQNLLKCRDETELKANGWYDKYYYVDYNLEAKSYQLKLFYCNSHPLHEVNDSDLKGHSVQITEDGLLDLIEQVPKHRLSYADKTIICGAEVYFCDSQGQLFLIDDKYQSCYWQLLPSQHNHLSGMVGSFPSHNVKKISQENLNQLLQQGFNDELAASCNIHTGESISCDDCFYYYINHNAQIECFKKVENGYIRLQRQAYTQKQDKLSVHEILFFNQCKIDRENKLDYFHYKTLLKNEVHQPGILHNILQDKTQFIDDKIKNVSELKNLYEIPQFQPNSSGSYFSAFTSGLLNAPYYFLGILTMATIPENLLVFAVGVCSFFMVLNVIAELYQEFDYQRRLDITAVKAKLSMVKRCISLEWDAINEYLADSVVTPNEKEYSFFDIQAKKNHLGSHGELELKYELSLIKLFFTDDEKDQYQHLSTPHNLEQGFEDELPPELTPLIEKASVRRKQFKSYFDQQKDIFLDREIIQNHFKKVFGEDAREISTEEFAFLISWVRLEQYCEEYKDLNKRLKTNLVIPPLATIMQGIKNGLHIYGMFNGLLITIYSMGAWSFNLSFFIFSIAVGISLVVFSTIYTALYAKPEEKEVTNNLGNSSELLSDTPHIEKIVAFQKKNNPEDLKVPYWYDKAKYNEIIANDNAIIPSKNLLISEQCEVFRQFISGFKKGIKFLESIFLLLPSVSSEPNVFTIIFYPVIALIYGMIFALKGLRGLMRVDKDDYENSILVGKFFEKPEGTMVSKSTSTLEVVTDLDDSDGMHSKEVNSAARAIARCFTPISFIACATKSSNNLAGMSNGEEQTPRLSM